MNIKTIATIAVAVLAICALVVVLVLKLVPTNVTNKPYKLSFGNKSVDCTYTGKWAVLSSEPKGGVYKFESNGIKVEIDESDSSVEKRTYTRILDSKVIMAISTSNSGNEVSKTTVTYNPNGEGKVERTSKTQGSNVSESYVLTFPDGKTEEMKLNENYALTGSDEALELYNQIQTDVNNLLKDVPGIN